MKSIAVGILASMVLFVGPLWASEKLHEGDWQGAGSSTSAECPDFDFWVSVKGNRVHGKAHQTGTDYRVEGMVTEKGEFTGSVTFMSFKVAELTGLIGAQEGDGEWKALKGPDCEGNFMVWKLG